MCFSWKTKYQRFTETQLSISNKKIRRMNTKKKQKQIQNANFSKKRLLFGTISARFFPLYCNFSKERPTIISRKRPQSASQYLITDAHRFLPSLIACLLKKFLCELLNRHTIMYPMQTYAAEKHLNYIFYHLLNLSESSVQVTIFIIIEKCLSM